MVKKALEMPSSTPKQAAFMRAVAHGFKPTGVKAPPVSVAKEFVKSDQAKQSHQRIAKALIGKRP